MVTTRRHRRGFTLIEALVVLVVIAITSGLVYQALLGTAAKVVSTEATGNQEQVILAELRYYDQYGAYTSDPSQLTGITKNVSVTTGVSSSISQVSISVGAITGKLGLASNDGATGCVAQVVDTVPSGAGRTIATVASTGSCVGTNALGSGQ